MALIYKICGEEEWKKAAITNVYEGSTDDRRDGYIHFSTAEQVPATLQRYFPGRHDLLLIAVDDSVLGDVLKYEPSRGGVLFPHLYGSLPLSTVLWQRPIALIDSGHVLPKEMRA